MREISRGRPTPRKDHLTMIFFFAQEYAVLVLLRRTLTLQFEPIFTAKFLHECRTLFLIFINTRSNKPVTSAFRPAFDHF